MAKEKQKPQTLVELLGEGFERGKTKLRSSKKRRHSVVLDDGELVSADKRMRGFLQVIPGTGYGQTWEQTSLIQAAITTEYFRNKGIRMVLYRMYTVLFLLQALLPYYFDSIRDPGIPHTIWLIGAWMSLSLALMEMNLINFMYGQDGQIGFLLQFFIPGEIHRRFTTSKILLQRKVEEMGIDESSDYSQKALIKLIYSDMGPNPLRFFKGKKRE